MLWYKAWLEVRLGLLFISIFAFYVVCAFIVDGDSPVAVWEHRMKNALFFTFILAAVALSGSWISLQSLFGARQGQSGAMQYTLSMPVTRRWLLAVRAMFGALACVALIAAGWLVLWCFSPSLRNAIGSERAVIYLLSVLTGHSLFFGIGVFFGTFMDDIWRFYATVLVFGGTIGLHVMSMRWPKDGFFRSLVNLTIPIASDSPWLSMAFCLAGAALFFWLAVRVIEAREY